mmetsp:Transcript_25197/g.58671  ORF Transcript_25197/g.58671 Transcript_25197/m.58671 type:complete len:222 (-) Transcript_25197:614-1279(-)
MDRPETEGVFKASKLIHWFKCLQQECSWNRNRSLMHKPARQARARQVLPPRNQNNLLHAILAARPHILYCKGTVADNGCVAALEVLVRDVVVHTIADLAFERLLSGVFYQAILCHHAREVEESTTTHFPRFSTLHICQTQLIESRVVRLASTDLQGINTGVELALRQQPVLFSGVLHVPEDPLLARPELPSVWCWYSAASLVGSKFWPKPDMERSKFGLQL